MRYQLDDDKNWQKTFSVLLLCDNFFIRALLLRRIWIFLFFCRFLTENILVNILIAYDISFFECIWYLPDDVKPACMHKSWCDVISLCRNVSTLPSRPRNPIVCPLQTFLMPRVCFRWIDLFRLNILFSQYRSCHDTQEIWSFVLLKTHSHLPRCFAHCLLASVVTD